MAIVSTPGDFHTGQTTTPARRSDGLVTVLHDRSPLACVSRMITPATRLISLMVFTGIAFAAAPCFEHDGWPEELIPTFATRHTVLTLHTAPERQAEAVALPVKAGEVISNADFNPAATRLSYVQSKVITRRSVLLTATATVTDVHCLSKPAAPMTDGKPAIQPGQQIEYLQYRAEGFILARYNGAICEVHVMDDPPGFTRMGKQPEVEWWIMLVDHEKQALGWFLVDETQLTLLPRTEGG